MEKPHKVNEHNEHKGGAATAALPYEVNEHNEQKGKNKMLGTKLRDWLLPMDIKDDEIITINGIKFNGFDLNHTRWNSPLMASTIQSVDIDRESGDIEITIYK